LSAAEINYQVTDLLPNSGNFVLLTVQAFTIFCQILLLIVGLYSLASLETFVVLIAFSIIGLLTTFLTKKVRNAAKKMPISQRRLLGSVQRVSRNRVLIAISKTANWEINRLNSASQDYHDAANKTARYVRVLTVFPPFMGIILITVIIYLSRNYFHTEPQVMLPFLYLLLRFGQQTGAFAQQIGSLNTFVLQFQDAMKLAEGWYERVSSFKTVARIDVQLSDIASKSPPVIQIKKLSFGWHPDQDLFQGLSMEIGPGEQVAIVGTSGRGKSTLLYLLLGLLKPSSGSITIAGILPSQFLCHPDSKIGYVGTDAYLISGSVRENILYGLDPSTISQETIHRVLGDANLLDTVEKLPNKLDHLINENGEGLSAGQKQRLSLARALLRMPKLLILDEASANLDNETEAQIAETLRSLKGTVTTVIVSHRQGLVKYADRVLSL
jgi:ATP-binding cassette subfamily B protein/subfamily B ATP-binding cassette protein MsbA